MQPRKFTPEACAKLREYLMYDPATGVFRWRKSIWGKAVTGRRAGNVYAKRGTDKYRRIGVLGGRYDEHQIAFLFMTGAVPALIDHKSGYGIDNTWDNLRAATPIQNGQNQRLRCDNSTGVKGVCRWGVTGRFQAYITVNKKRIPLGLFNTIASAASARRTAEIKYFGAFSRRLV